MTSKHLDTDKIKKELLSFTKESVSQFLKANGDLTFYAFGFDCNADYAEVNLCFNTEISFEKTLRSYQSGEYAEHYQSEESINELKYNFGDWEYQCFATTYVLTDDESADIYGDDIEKQADDLMKLFCDVLLDFMFTEEYSNIPKTENFKVLCCDHDEPIEDSELRLSKIKHLRNNGY